MKLVLWPGWGDGRIVSARAQWRVADATGLALMVGPMGAAMFATYSLKAGFVAVGVLVFALAGLVAFAVQEPPVEK